MSALPPLVCASLFMFGLSPRPAVLAGQVTHPRTLSDESDCVDFGFAYVVLGIALDCQDTFIATRKYMSYLNYEIKLKCKLPHS